MRHASLLGYITTSNPKHGEHPQTEGKTDYEDSRTLQIVEELHVKAGRGPQLVVCRLNNDDQDYVAKIYDPLYYDPEKAYDEDVTLHSDMMYSREAAAYNEMDKFNAGFEALQFYGSWTFQAPLSLPTGQKMRDVRMILIERIHRKSMAEFDKTSISESERLITLKLMAQIIELLSWHGVRHEYTGPWNVMLCDSGIAGEVGRIVIIGFSGSVVTTLDNTYFRYGTPDPWPDKPANPLNRWWWGQGARINCFYEHFWEWLSESRDSRIRPLQEWMYDIWGKNDLFAPPFRKLIYEDEEERWYRNEY